MFETSIDLKVFPVKLVAVGFAALLSLIFFSDALISEIFVPASIPAPSTSWPTSSPVVGTFATSVEPFTSFTLISASTPGFAALLSLSFFSEALSSLTVVPDSIIPTTVPSTSAPVSSPVVVMPVTSVERSTFPSACLVVRQRPLIAGSDGGST